MDEWFAVFVAMSRVLTRGASRWRLQGGSVIGGFFGRRGSRVASPRAWYLDFQGALPEDDDDRGCAVLQAVPFTLAR